MHKSKSCVLTKTLLSNNISIFTYVRAKAADHTFPCFLDKLQNNKFIGGAQKISLTYSFYKAPPNPIQWWCQNYFHCTKYV